MRNVLYINHVSEVSGAEKVLLNLVSSLIRNDINPSVICSSSGRLFREFESKGIPVRIIPMSLLVRTYNPIKLFIYLINFIHFSLLLKQELKKAHIDIIHCNTFTATLYSAFSAWITNTPLIWHMHDILQLKLFNKLFIRLAALCSIKIICVSHAVKNNLIEFGVKKEQCEVIYNSIHDSIEKNDMQSGSFRKELGVNNNTKIITMIGQIAKWKGQDVLIDAIPKLLSNYKDVKVVIVGDVISIIEQEYKEYIYNKVLSLKLSEHIAFMGFRDDVEKIIIDSYLLVHASVNPDPLPTVLIEAMNACKPVIATNVGGVPEIVVDNKTGYIVPPRDSDALATAILKLINSPSIAKTMGIEAQHIVNTKFNSQDNRSKILELYSSVL